MAVAVEQVPVWMIDRGIGHAVAGPGIGSGWAHWACGTMTPFGEGDLVRVTPSKICKKCREALKGATLKQSA